MIEAFWYALAAALTFIGFVSVLCLVILYIFKSKSKALYIIAVSPETDSGDIPNLIYSAHLRYLIFGNLLCDGVVVIDCGLDEKKRQLVSETASQYSGVSVVRADEFTDCITGKEKDGSGAC